MQTSPLFSLNGGKTHQHREPLKVLKRAKRAVFCIPGRVTSSGRLPTGPRGHGCPERAQDPRSLFLGGQGGPDTLSGQPWAEGIVPVTVPAAWPWHSAGLAALSSLVGQLRCRAPHLGGARPPSPMLVLLGGRG